MSAASRNQTSKGAIVRVQTILVVEDDPLVRASAMAFFTAEQHDAIEAANALEAVAILEERATPVGAIFSDINMPGEMDGLELARFAKRRWPEMVVVLTSGGVHGASSALLDGVDAFFAKPYKVHEVAMTIRSLLDGRGS
jgi:DNA-binding NtrC family response regulator